MEKMNRVRYQGRQIIDQGSFLHDDGWAGYAVWSKPPYVDSKMPPRVPRRAHRHQVHGEAKTVNAQLVTETFLVDLGASGARIEAPHPLARRMHLE